MRANATPAERMLWHRLDARQIAGIRFNRQFPIGPFICDFVSRSTKLVIEVDGGQHCDSESDVRRTQYLEAQGYRVVRFWNKDVMVRIEGVAQEIRQVLEDMPSPDPSREREGR